MGGRGQSGIYPPSILVAATMLLMVLLLDLKIFSRSNDNDGPWSGDGDNYAATTEAEAQLPVTGYDNQ